MDISKVVIEAGKLVGAIVIDETETYPITAEGLHNSVIFDGLLESGWKFVQMPYGFKRDGVRLTDLPQVTWEELNPTEQENQDMYDIAADTYPDAVLRSHLDVSEVETFEFRQSQNKIATRAEFIEFLKNTDQIELGNEADFLPINSFVSPVALFTVEEYYADENHHYREIIENRRKLSFTNLCKIAEAFKEFGLPDDYTALDLVDMYFSWGICGIKFTAFDKKKKRTPFRVTSTLDEQADIETTPYIEMLYQSYLREDGTVFREQATMSSEWKPESSRLSIADKMKRLQSYGENYITPEKLKGSITEEIFVISGQNVEITYDDTVMKIVYMQNGRDITRSAPSLRVRKIGVEGLMPSTCLTLNAKGIFTEIFLTAMCNDLMHRSFRRSVTSSYEAISTLGASPMGIAYFVFNRQDVVQNLNGDLKELGNTIMRVTPVDFIAAIESHLAGNLSQSDPLYTLVEDSWNDLISGSLNIDNVLSGQIADASRNGESEFKDYLRVAMKYLGISTTEIRNKVLEVTEETAYLEFSGNDMHLRIELPSTSEQDNGYMIDVDEYRACQASNASSFGYITSIWRELGGPLNQKRHVGFEMDLIDASGSKAAKLATVRGYLYSLINNIIENEVSYDKQKYLKEKIPMIIVNQYFHILMRNQIHLPKILGGKVIDADPGIREMIRACTEHVIDSTLNLSEITITPTGNLVFYCVNAIITPEYIIPREGQKIKEVSMIPMWYNNVGCDEQRAVWWNRGLLPSPNFTGYKPLYPRMHLPRYGLVVDGKVYDNYSVSVDPYSLLNYFDEAMTFAEEFPKDKELVPPVHPYDKKYHSADEYITDDYDSRVTGEVGSAQRWSVGDAKYITMQDVLNRNPELGRLFMIQKKGLPHNLGVHTFTGFSAEDFFVLADTESVDKSLRFDTTKIPIDGISGDNVVLFNTVPVLAEKIPDMYAIGDFQINRVSGNKYLMRDRKGIVYEVVV